MGRALYHPPLLGLIFTLNLACSASPAKTPDTPATAATTLTPATSAAATATPAAAAETYTFAFLVRGPTAKQRPQDEREKIQAAHMGNIKRLAEEKKLLIAGPFGDGNPHEEVRGIFLFDTADLEVARAWTGSDPAVQAGVLGMELAKLRSSSPVRRSLDLDTKMREELKRAGKEPKMGEMIRGFVMVLGREPEKAERALASLRAGGKVLFEGRLEGSERARYLAVLDAETVDAAGALLGAERANVGEHEMVSWWSTRALTGLATPR